MIFQHQTHCRINIQQKFYMPNQSFSCISEIIEYYGVLITEALGAFQKLLPRTYLLSRSLSLRKIRITLVVLFPTSWMKRCIVNLHSAQPKHTLFSEIIAIFLDYEFSLELEDIFQNKISYAPLIMKHSISKYLRNSRLLFASYSFSLHLNFV